MLRSAEAANSLVIIWKGLLANRAHDFVAPLPGYEQFTGDLLSALFESWKERLEAASAAKWIDSPDIVVADDALSKLFNSVNALVSQTSTTGFSWLMASTGFLESLAQISQRVAAITDWRANVAHRLAKDLRGQAVAEAGFIQQSAGELRTLIDHASSASELTSKAESALAEVVASGQKIAEVSANLGSLRSEAETAGQETINRRSEAERLLGEITAFRQAAESDTLGLKSRIGALQSDLDASQALTATAYQDLRRALTDTRRQGLAEAFMARAARLDEEHRTWLWMFYIAVMILVVMAAWFATDLSKFDFETLTVALLRRIALAAPAIWLGWYAARQVGKINRIREDYEYKAATALAFLSYKNEVESTGKDELIHRLLDTTIRTFGENPTRLYEDEVSSEPSTPVEQLLAKFESDGTLKLLERVSKIFAKT